jgi:hypothetical protein
MVGIDVEHRLPAVMLPSAAPAAVVRHAGLVCQSRARSAIGEVLEDSALVMLLAYAAPVAILLMGTPIVLLARVAVEAFARLLG